jgi:hypothetical protein
MAGRTSAAEDRGNVHLLEVRDVEVADELRLRFRESDEILVTMSACAGMSLIASFTTITVRLIRRPEETECRRPAPETGAGKRLGVPACGRGFAVDQLEHEVASQAR